MKYHYLLATLLAGLMSLQVSSAPRMLEQMKKMDLDEDGSITLEEFNSNTLSRFKLMDDNGDGILSKKEFLTPINERFEKIDLNSDGVIKRKEIRKALKKFRKDKKEEGVREKSKPKPFIKH